jgi:hypothetical protein
MEKTNENSIVETEEQEDIFVERDYSALVSEYKKLYGTLEQQIELFSHSQPAFVDELTQKVEKELPDYPEERTIIIAKAYGILITEDILNAKIYSINDFANDIAALMKFLDKKEEITNEDYLGVITTFREAIETASMVVYKLGRNIVTYKGNDISDDVIKMLLIRRGFFPAFRELLNIYQLADLNPDYRWIINHFSMAYEQLFREKKLTDNVSTYNQLYHKIMDLYPLDSDPVILWDLLLTGLVDIYYENQIELLKPEIKALAERLKEEKKVSKRSYERAKFVASQQGRTEQIRSAIDSILLETLHLEWELTPAKEQRMKKNTEIILKRMAIEKHGVQDLPNPQEYFNFLEDSFYEVFDEYPQLLLPLIEPKDYRNFVRDPPIFMKENEERIKQQISYQLRRHIKGTKYTPRTVAHGFCSLLFELLRDRRIKQFDLR